MKFRSEIQGDCVQEMTNIFNNSFMIMDHPHSGANPVLIYERLGPGMYRAKVSVFLVSLLHDFMVTHPNVLQFYDIGEFRSYFDQQFMRKTFLFQKSVYNHHQHITNLKNHGRFRGILVICMRLQI